MSAEEAARCEVSYNRLRMKEEQFLRYAENLAKGIPVKSDEDCEGQPGPEMGCRAGRSSFWLSWDGKLSPCGMLPTPCANPLEVGIQAAWEQVRDQVKQIRLPSACLSCQYRHGCHVCAAICYCETGHCDGKPEYLCQLTKCAFEQTLAEAKTIGGSHGDQT